MSDNTLNPMESKKPKEEFVLEFVPITNIQDLKPGDLVRGKSSRTSFIVTWNYGSRVTAVASADITNPIEWEVLRSKNHTNG